MPKQSIFAPISIPSCNVLTFLFPPDSEIRTSTKPIWIDAIDPAIQLSAGAALAWIKRLSQGLDNLRNKQNGGQLVKRGEVVLIFTPNHVFVPVAYMGIVGSGRIFSGINPAYSVNGRPFSFPYLPNAVLLIDNRGGLSDAKYRGEGGVGSSIFTRDGTQRCRTSWSAYRSTVSIL